MLTGKNLALGAAGIGAAGLLGNAAYSRYKKGAGNYGYLGRGYAGAKSRLKAMYASVFKREIAKGKTPQQAHAAAAQVTKKNYQEGAGNAMSLEESLKSVGGSSFDGMKMRNFIDGDDDEGEATRKMWEAAGLDRLDKSATTVQGYDGELMDVPSQMGQAYKQRRRKRSRSRRRRTRSRGHSRSRRRFRR
mgnify:FL=1